MEGRLTQIKYLLLKETERETETKLISLETQK